MRSACAADMRSACAALTRPGGARLVLVVVILLLASSGDATSHGGSGKHEAYEINAIPGLDGPLLSRHYAGYLDVSATKHLYFYFVESQSDPVEDPLLLWLNGGPGCSSFDGWVYEHGPFNLAFINSKVALKPNPFTWAGKASMLFLDSPVGVGYSYSSAVDTADDYTLNDTITARDAEVFLRAFFALFHHFRRNTFVIGGESYGGIYVPNLARAVIDGNRAGHHPHINLQAYLVGNGCTDPLFDGNALPSFARGKSLISHGLYDRLQAECGSSYWNVSSGSSCDRLLSGELDRALRGLNIYNVLKECYRGPNITAPLGLGALDGLDASLLGLLTPDTTAVDGAPQPRLERQFGRGWPLRSPVVPGPLPTWAQMRLQVGAGEAAGDAVVVPCMDSRLASAFLNDPVVRTTLHAQPADVAGSWQICTGRIKYSHDAGSMVGVHRRLTHDDGLRALVYSGDHDMCVPHTGSELWTRSLGYVVEQEWRPWMAANGQVSGYVVQFAHGLTFATVKGAGHTVPEYKPREALAMFERFLNGVPL